jgi:hypothetical protein
MSAREEGNKSSREEEEKEGEEDDVDGRVLTAEEEEDHDDDEQEYDDDRKDDEGKDTYLEDNINDPEYYYDYEYEYEYDTYIKTDKNNYKREFTNIMLDKYTGTINTVVTALTITTSGLLLYMLFI